MTGHRNEAIRLPLMAKLFGSVALGVVLVACSGAPAPAPPVEASSAPPNDPPVAVSSTAAVAAEPAPDSTEVAKKPVDPPPPEGNPPGWLAKTPEAYKAGDALRYLPKDCAERIYFDTAALVGTNGKALQDFVEKALIAKGDDREKQRVEAVIALVRAERASPVTTWRELAICKSEENREVIAVGFAPEHAVEVPVLVQKIKLALSEDPGRVVRKGERSSLDFLDGETVVQPGPNVFLVSKDLERLTAGIDAKGGAAGFAAAKGQLVFAKTRKADASVVEKSGNLEAKIVVHLHGGEADAIKKNPKKFTETLTGMAGDVADKLKGSSLEPIGEKLRAVKITINGPDVILSSSISRSLLETTLKNTTPADIEKLSNMR